MDELKDKYELLVRESKENPWVLGLFLGGSRAKSESFVTEKSDLDVYVILSDDAPEGVRTKLKGYESEYFEIRLQTLSEFTNYANWGDDKEWDKYNFAHNKAVIDKNGQIQKIMDEKVTLPVNVQQNMIKGALDSYFNQVYRSAKYWRDGNVFAAHLDAAESLPFLTTALYALEGRIKPYNKYFEWELKNHPLKLLPWPPEDFIADYKYILETGDIKTQEKIFKEIKELFIKRGFGTTIQAWANYYFVGE